MSNQRGCFIGNCRRVHYAKGMCKFHYQRMMTWRLRFCERCGKEIKDVEKRRKFCLSCRPLEAEANRSLWSNGKDGNRATKLMFMYRLTLEQFDQLLRGQDGCCWICHTDQPNGGWTVDHDHACCAGYRSCGKCVRGILCRFCNSMLGKLNDDPEAFRRAAKYLEKV